MRTSGHSANPAPTSKLRLFATLRASLPASGSGASSSGGARLALLSVLALCVMALSTTPAVAAGCPNEQVRVEQASTRLPDCRAYEMVSPVYKGGYGANAIAGVAPDGEGAAFSSQGAFAGAPASFPTTSLYVARRGSEGWQTTPLIAPASVAPNVASVASFSASLGLTLVAGDLGPNSEVAARAGERAFLVHPTATPDTAENWRVAGMVFESAAKEAIFNGVAMPSFGESADFSHIVFGGAGVPPLRPSAVGTRDPLYDLQTQLSGGDPVLRLVGVTNEALPGGEPEPIDPYCPVALGGFLSGFNAVSADGATIFFTTNANRSDKDINECEKTSEATQTNNPPIVYARLGGGKTVQVAVPVAADCSVSAPCHSAAQAPAEYMGASADGARVFFMTTQPLVTGDTDTGNDLYMATIGCPGGGGECEPSQREVTSMTQVSHHQNASEPARVQGVVAVSQDGTRVYFVARGVLGEAGVQPLGQGVQSQPVKGADNLYVYDAATQGTAFVADVCSEPGKSGELEDQRCPLGAASTPDTRLWSSGTRAAQLNACTGGEPSCQAGRFLVFVSSGRLVSGDTNSNLDVYRYDSGTGALQRVSVGEEGADANGNGGSSDALILPAQLGGHAQEASGLKTRAVSDDGSRVVFTTARPLSERAGQGVSSAYEWHQASSEAGEGRVSLISGSGFTEGVEDLVISPSGRDVFFVTAQGLVAHDGDGQVDVYDARVAGGFTPSPAERAACAADACYGPLTNPAPLLVPGSFSQAPGGNFPLPATAPTPKRKPAKCRKGFVKQRNRCVKQRKGPKARRARKARAGQPTHQPQPALVAAAPVGVPRPGAAVSATFASQPVSASSPAAPSSSPAPRRSSTSASPRPLEITHFSLQTTGPTREEPFSPSETGAGQGCHFEPLATGTKCRFVNEPYAFTQAGGHPYALTFDLQFATEERAKRLGGLPFIYPTRDPKDIVQTLPAGLLGNPTAAPTCPSVNVLTKGLADLCPASSQIGWNRLRFAGGNEFAGPIVNLTPEAGQSAEFGLENSAITYVLTAHLVRTAAGYSVVVESNEIPLVGLSEAELTFWGVPADPSHDAQRGLFCEFDSNEPKSVRQYLACGLFNHPLKNVGFGLGGESAGVAPVPFLSLGSDCAAGAEQASVRADSWEEPGVVREGKYSEQYKEASVLIPALTGCNQLAFNPELEVHPDTLQADAPVGLGVNIKVPQPQTPEGVGTPDLRDAVVSLPEGVSISPGIVDGVQACNESGPEGINFSGPESEEVALNGELQLAAGHCPDASTVGTAKAFTPLLNEPVEGHVYLARPGCGGAGQALCTSRDALDGNLYKLYLELGGKGRLGRAGVNIKVPGFVEANPATGQLTTKFLENPQTPFSKLEVDLNGGARAPLDNPASCGAALTTADFAPWSAPGITPEGLSVAGTGDATPSSSFNVDLAGDGLATPCPALPFNPGFLAGMVTPQAGQFSSFTLNLARHDREQFVKGLQIHTPPGLLAVLSSVPLCPDAQANAGTCPAASKIGTTRVASGAGSHPFEIEGTIYLTGPHAGAPFGLSIVTHAVAGPFDLGLVVVRARIDIDPVDSTATITTDETGPYAIPQILDGVPLRLQRITTNIDRPGFMFNPTDCGAPGQPPQQVTAVVSGSANTKTSVSSPLAVGGCKSLAFTPSFKVSTNGRTSKVGGASLDAKVSYPAGSMGSQANISYVKVELPKQLPSRLTTLQKACLAATFEANPAACPAGSVIGVVRTTTPLLPVPLSGPVYFVSHGGEAFPSLVAVLQGDGVRVDLTGSTFISKAGVTSTTFKTVPDVPINSFELYLPEGPNSALAANTNLCAAAGQLKMPNEFIAHNGAVLKQTTTIAVTGCPKAPAKKAKKAKRARKGASPGGRRAGA
ncbi:MAG TPA: hypothetical protein VNY27_08700 [Solirubrobacteraceae bacterium]|nr:hypothetical protein [Solirubrobacteraceae bacterium]